MKRPELGAYKAHMMAVGYHPTYAMLQYNLICEGQYRIAVTRKALRVWLRAGGELPKKIKEDVLRLRKKTSS
jgi:hypothetical protein